MKINSIARKVIAERFESAIKREGLSKAEAAALLGVTTGRVLNLLDNKRRDKISDSAMEKFKGWSNLGISLREYGSKVGDLRSPCVDNTTEPVKKETNLKKERFDVVKARDNARELFAAGVKEDIPIERLAGLFGVDLAELNLVLNNGGSGCKAETTEAINVWVESGMSLKAWGNIDSGPGEKVLSQKEQDAIGEPHKAVIPGQATSIDEIKELLENWRKEMPEIIPAILEETTEDRLTTFLVAINQLKEMGFDVDLHISPSR